MKKIAKLIPEAIKAAEKFVATSGKDKDDTDKKLLVPEQFKGYISSFGASVIHAGLLPTLAFYSEGGKAKGDRSMLIPALTYLLIKRDFWHGDQKALLENILLEIEHQPKKIETRMHELFAPLLAASQAQHEKLKNEMMTAAVALKLALRTFTEDKNKTDEHE